MRYLVKYEKKIIRYPHIYLVYITHKLYLKNTVLTLNKI
jgi:hypothetical protein